MSCWHLRCCGRELCLCGYGNGTVDLGGEALGLPPKTIRACLAFVILTSMMALFVGVTVVLAIWKEYSLMIGVLGTVSSIGSGVLGFYFGVRSGSAPQDLERNRKMQRDAFRTDSRKEEFEKREAVREAEETSASESPVPE